MYARVIFFVLTCWTCLYQGTSGRRPTVNVQKYLDNPQTFKTIRKSVSDGTERAMQTCKKIFTNEKWNCHVELDRIKPFPVFARRILPATKEGAYLQSLGSAGVMYTLTLNCRKGKFKDCSCKTVNKPAKKGQTWRWSGCNDNTDFGEAMTIKFVDALEKGSSPKRKALNLHNNNVGRKVVKRAAKKVCKCHGISGSCALRVCWRELVPFQQVGEMVKEKYDNAVHVAFKNSELQDKSGSHPSLGKKTVAMVFYEESPDYCKPINGTKYQGMVGRKCSTDKEKLSDCRRPCNQCGMQVTETTKTFQKQCQCKFHWCCRVKCETCETKYIETTCVR